MSEKTGVYVTILLLVMALFSGGIPSCDGWLLELKQTVPREPPYLKRKATSFLSIFAERNPLNSYE